MTGTVGAPPLASRDRKRPAAPVGRDARRGGALDLLRFFLAARKDLLSAFGADAYRERWIRNRIGRRDSWIISDPDAVRHILLDRAANYVKGPDATRRLSPALGDAILTAEGEAWRWQRRAAAPAFSPRNVAAFAPAMARAAEALVTAWAASGDRERDVTVDMSRLTYDVLARTIFSTGARIDEQEMFRHLTTYLDTAGSLDLAAFLSLPEWVPTLNRLRARPAVRFFKEEVGRLARERIALIAANPDDAPDDLLTSLIRAIDPETGRPVSARDVVDNTITFVMAGHETTANALSWTLYLLSEFSWARERVEAELARELDGRAPEAADLPRLVYLRQVLDEAMRLYPPVGLIVRSPLADDQVDGRVLRAGSMILVAPWFLHRHETLWDEPDLFDPERFAPDRRDDISRFAYLPFGAGPRICIGASFAAQEAMILLAVILQRWRLDLVAGQTISPRLTITLRPRHGLRMKLTPR